MKKNVFTLVLFFALTVFVSNMTMAAELELFSQSACLMEAETGRILYEKNADERLEPASVTKIMSMILVFEAIDDGKFDYDTVVSASEYASSMGGSQIWLEEGETMTVNEMLKAVAVASANDCTVALSELVCGSEEAFVEKMNEKAVSLGMTNTHFSNCTGLPVENHYTTARDIAIMTRELHKHPEIYNYTKIWMDTLREGEFGISNTNKLIRFYSGATGMKTGYTSSALYCMSATANRNDMNLIAAVMKCESSDKRFSDAKKLLDYGFANYTMYKPKPIKLPKIRVLGGKQKYPDLEVLQNNILIEKGAESKISVEINVPDEVTAPVKKNKTIGQIVYSVEGKEIASFDIKVKNDVEKLGYLDIFRMLLEKCVTVR